MNYTKSTWVGYETPSPVFAALNKIEEGIENAQADNMVLRGLASAKPAVSATTVGRLYIETDSPYKVWRDNGAVWDFVGFAPDADGNLVVSNLYENQPFSYAGNQVFIVSPYVTKPNAYKGQTHAHSTNSDGNLSPTDLAILYRNAGYNFLVFTDHDFLTPDPGVAGILGIGGVEETTTEGDVISINPLSQKVSAVAQTVIDAILVDGGIPIMAHPNNVAILWSDAELESIVGYFGIECYTAGSPVPNAEDKWDTLLTKHRKVFGLASDDYHDPGWPFNAGWIVVFADSLTTNDIIDNIKRGNFYSSTGPILSISVSGRAITATTGNLGTIAFIVSGGTIKQSTPNATSASYTVVGDEVYVRAKITRNSDGKNAWSNPIYVYQGSASELALGGVIRGNLYISGNIGIGTTEPNFKLDVNGDVRIEEAHKLYFGGTGPADNDTNLYRGAADQLKTDDSFVLGTLIRIDTPSGLLGVGTLTPATRLDLRKSTSDTLGPTGGIVVLGDDLPYWTFREAATASADLAIDRLYAGSYYEAMRIRRSNGNVGIGTAPAASAKLDIGGTNGALLLPRLTTVQQAALTAVNGMVVYNTDNNRLEAYENGAWVDL